jgi:hypothetical protein
MRAENLRAGVRKLDRGKAGVGSTTDLVRWMFDRPARP